MSDDPRLGALEKGSIQSEVLCGNFPAEGSKPKYGAYLLVKFPTEGNDAREEARQFLREIKPTWADAGNTSAASLNIGFTFEGLAFLLDPAVGNPTVEDALAAVGAPFEELIETMAGRSDALGDAIADRQGVHLSDAKGTSHAILMFFAFEPDKIDLWIEHVTARLKQIGVAPEVHRGNDLTEQREHFGYVDGISQPVIEHEQYDKAPGHGTIDENGNWRGIRPGEFVLGYDDEEGPFDGSLFLKNGTFFVLRKLEQDVDAFHSYLEEAAMQPLVSCAARKEKVDPIQWVAARLMGRYLDGAPLLAKDLAGPYPNDFRYAADNTGFGCPFGAHIRRVNPRDVSGRLSDRSERHRMIRRTLMYTETNKNEYQLETTSFGKLRLKNKALGNGEPGRARGMLFGCFNASIGRQFEVVQGGWLNGGESAPGKLFTLRDPIAGANHGDTGDFIVPARPLIVLPNIKKFTTTRGGGYFFIPGKQALKRLLAVLPARSPKRKQEWVESFQRYLQNPQQRQTLPTKSLRRVVSNQVLSVNPVPELPPRPFSPRKSMTSRETEEVEDRVLIVLAPIAPGRRSAVEMAMSKVPQLGQKESGMRMLDAALDDVRVGGAPVIHHARFSIVTTFARFPDADEPSERGTFNPTDDPVSGAGDAYLFFACWFDGARNAFLKSLAEQGHRLPFRYCWGWPERTFWDAILPNRRVAFLRERELPAIFAYQAYPNATAEIRQALNIREKFVELIARGQPADKFRELLGLLEAEESRPRASRSDAQTSVLDGKRAR